MMTGPSRPMVAETIVAMNATTTLRRWSARTGASRRSADSTDGLVRSCTALSLYGFVVAGASLGVIDLHVLGTRREQLLVRAGGQHFAFHEQDDLVVVF